MYRRSAICIAWCGPIPSPELDILISSMVFSAMGLGFVFSVLFTLNTLLREKQSQSISQPKKRKKNYRGLTAPPRIPLHDSKTRSLFPCRTNDSETSLWRILGHPESSLWPEEPSKARVWMFVSRRASEHKSPGWASGRDRTISETHPGRRIFPANEASIYISHRLRAIQYTIKEDFYF